MTSSLPSEHSQRISDYLLRKERLIEQASAGFAPVVRAFVAALCADLRQCRPDTAHALLLEMFLTGVGIDDETRARCLSTCQHYREYYGLAIRRHQLQVDDDEATVTLEFSLLHALDRLVSQTLGESVPLVVRARLGSSDDDLHDVALLQAERLDLADLEPLCAALADYWANCIDVDGLPEGTPAGKGA